MMKRFTSQARKSVNIIRLFIGFALLASTLVLPVGVAQAAETVEPDAPGKMFPESHNIVKRQKFVDSKISNEKVDCKTSNGGAALYQIIDDTDLVKYDPLTGEYGDKITIKGVGKTLNGLLVDPEGRVFAAHMTSNNGREFVQILPESKSFKKLVSLTSSSNSYNAGTYIEEDGVPYAVLSQAYGKTAIKINLNEISSPPLEIPLGVSKQNSNSKSKDFIWVQEGLVVDNHTYYIVGIYVKGGTLEVYLSDMNGKSTKKTYSGYGSFDGVYGAGYNFKAADDPAEITEMFFSNNFLGGMMQLVYKNNSFSLVRIGDSDKTNDNDGGGCPFTEANMGPVDVSGVECGTGPNLDGSRVLIKIYNSSSSIKKFDVWAQVDESFAVDPTSNDSLEWKEYSVGAKTTKIIKVPILWEQSWEVKVRDSSTKKEILFSPTGDILNEEGDQCPAPPDDKFEPKVPNSDVKLECVGDPSAPKIIITLDNTDSTIDANFTITVEDDIATKQKEVSAGSKEEIEIAVPEDSEWSLTWTSEPSDTQDKQNFDDVAGSYTPPSQDSPADCEDPPPEDKFDPKLTFRIQCGRHGPQLIVGIDNTESTVDGTLHLTVTDVNGETDHSINFVMETDSPAITSIPIPEDSYWSISWEAVASEGSFDPITGAEQQNSKQDPKDTDCVEPPPPPEKVGNVYGYVWVDRNEDGQRTEITGGEEEHIKGAKATLTNVSDFLDSDGTVLFVPGTYEEDGKVREAITGEGTDGGTDETNYRWFIDNVPIQDPQGNIIQWKVTIDYEDAEWPTDFEPEGYTTKNETSVTKSEKDSDVEPLGGTLGVSSPFTLVEGLDEHRADAGVITGDPPPPPLFTPEVTIEMLCSYNGFDNPNAKFDITVDNTKSEVEAVVTVTKDGMEVGNFPNVEAGSTNTVPFIGEHDQKFEVNVVAGENPHLYEPIISSKIVDCPRFEIDVFLSDTDCGSDPPTATVVFKNDSDISVVFSYFTSQTQVGGGRNSPLLTSLTQQQILPAGEEVSILFNVNKNWTWRLNWDVVDSGSDQEFFEKGSIPAEGSERFVPCPGGFEVDVEITVECTDSGPEVTIKVDNTASTIDAHVSWFDSDRGPQNFNKVVAAGEDYETNFPGGANGVIWTVSGYADPQVENFEGDSSVRAEATVDCPIPQLSLLQDCADEVLKIEIDNKDLEVDGILTVTEVLLGATEATILDVDSKVPAGEKITTTIDFIYGAKYFATLTSSDGSSYQQVSEETVITCEEPVVIEPFDCAANPSLIQNLKNQTAQTDEIKALDLTDGTYKLLYSIPFNYTEPPYVGFNALAIDPVDDFAYATVRLNIDGEERSFLTRFDQDQIGFLAELPVSKAFSGTIDADGDYLFERGGNLYRVEKVSDLEAFENFDTPGVLDLTDGQPIYEGDPKYDTGDITYWVTADGASISKYVFGVVRKTDQIMMIEYGESSSDFKLLVPADENNIIVDIPDGTYGAAWNADGRIIVSANAGGLYEIYPETISGTRVQVRKLADTEATGNNDGMNCDDIPVCLPEEFGNVYGYAWIDWEESGDRTQVIGGAEEHLKGVTVTLTLESEYRNSEGEICEEFGESSWVVQTDGQNESDYQWEINNVPAKDNFGNDLLYKASFDYKGATFPDGFSPTGYTKQLADEVTASEVDSDVLQNTSDIPTQATDPMILRLLMQHEQTKQINLSRVSGPTTLADEDASTGSTTATSGLFTLLTNETVHRADAGILGYPVFEPISVVTIDCYSETARVLLDNTGSTVDANFKVTVYNGAVEDANEISSQSGEQLVPAGTQAFYAKAIPPPLGDTLTIFATAVAEHNGIQFGPDNAGSNQSGTYCDPPFSVQVNVLPNCPTLDLTLKNLSAEEMNLDPGAPGVPARFTVTLYQDGVPQELGNIYSAAGRYYELDPGFYTIENLSLREDSTWLIEWKAEDLTDPERTFEGVIGPELFDCKAIEIDPEVSFSFECAAETGDQNEAVFSIDNSGSDGNIDFYIKQLDEIIYGPYTVQAGGIRDVVLPVDHQDEYSVVMTASEVQPEPQTQLGNTNIEIIGESARITKQTLNTTSQISSSTEVVVESGDTLSEIAAEHGIKTSELMAANGIVDASRIFMGQKLQIPNQVKPETIPVFKLDVVSKPSSTVEVTVQSGDTLSEIAAEHGIKTSELMAANGIVDASRIFIGQKLKISKVKNAPNWDVISLLAETLQAETNSVMFNETDGENTGIEVDFTGSVDDFEVDCPVFEPDITFTEYCGDKSLHISVSNKDSDIAGEILIYENGEVVSEGAVLPGGVFTVDYPFTFGATYQVVVNPVGSSNGFAYDPVSDEHEIGCETPFDPTVETSFDCSNYGPVATVILNNTASHSAAEFTLKLIIEDSPENIEIGPIYVGSRSESEIDLATEIGITRSALEDATWRFEWTAIDPENESSIKTGTTQSATTDCLPPVGPFDCASNLAPLQIVLADSGVGYELNTLNLATGSLQTIYSIPFTRTSPSYSEINGIGFNPIDETVYGFIRIKQDNISSSYMIRFDSEQIEYLAQVTNFPNSATFDDHGNFLWMTDGSLYKAENASNIKGYVDHQDSRMPDLSNEPPVYDARDEGDVYGHAVDIAHIKTDIGFGTTDYIAGMVYGADQIVLIGYEGDDLARRLLDPVDRTGEKANLPGGGYGSAWSIGGQVFVASNSGEVFQLALDQTEITSVFPIRGNVEIRRIGNSAANAHNDGTNCPGVPACFPEIFGDVFGYVWIDWDASGDRTAIEYGQEEHIAGVNVTLTNTSPFYNSQGEPCYQAGELEVSSTYTGQGSSAGQESGKYRWWIDDLPAKDNSGNRITYKATFDYAEGQFPQGFTPTGYTVKRSNEVVASEVDSDVQPQNFTRSLNTTAVSGEFTIEPESSSHRADAGVVGVPVFAPTATVEIDCDAGSADVVFDNSGSTVQAKYEVNVYHGDVEENNRVQSQSGDKIVDAYDVVDYGKQIPPPRGQILTILITATPQKDDVDLGFEPVNVWNQAGVNCPTGFVVQVQVETDCDSGGVQVILDNSESSVEAIFTLVLTTGVETGFEDHGVADGDQKEVLISVTEDSDWTLMWTAVETGQSEDEEGFIGFIGPEQFNCEPEEFLPIVSVDHVCDILGDTATFSIDNTDSGVDAIVEVYSDDELIWGPTIIEKGTESYETTIPVTGIEAITIRVAAGENSHNYGTTTIKETLNCPETQVAPFDCASFPALIQIVGTNDVGFEVKELNPASGEYRPIYSIPFNRTPSYTGMNAAGINKVDSIAYALMSLNSTSTYLVRFDAQEVLFVAKMPYMTAAGDVDESGNFIWTKNSERTLSVLPDITNMEGFKDPADAPDMSNWGPTLESVEATASDIATMIYDFGEGEGNYAMGLRGKNLYVYRYDDPTQAWIIKVSIPQGSTSPIPDGSFGAAWSHEDRIYFASNKGLGVFEVMIPTIDFESKTAEIRKVANSDPTGWNDGMNCTGIPTCIPDIFGSTYGYSWIDWDKSGDRTSIEDGIEEHIAGVKVTLTNTTTYHDSEGNECYGPGEFVLETTTGADGQSSGQDTGDYRWYLSDVPVEDSFGNEMRYEVHFDYEEAILPEGFTPLGYTQQPNNDLQESEIDSDARPIQTTFFATTKAVSEDFSLIAGEEVHRPDAGIVGELTFDPTATVDIDCLIELAQVELDNSESDIDALYTVDVYHGEINEVNKIVDQSGTQIVESGDLEYYATAIPPPTGEILTVIVNAEAVREGLELEYEKAPVWNQAGTDCPSDFVAQVQVETDCDIGGAKVTLGNPGTDTGAIFEIALIVEGIKYTTEYELDADDTHILDLAIEDDSEWFIEWQAKEISEEEFRFSAATTPRTIDCEEPLFTPIISTGFTCTTVGAVITVFVDNRISEIDSIVEIELNTELSWGPETINAGDISNVITIPAVDDDFVRVWVNSADESTNTAAVMAEETVDCPIFDPEAYVDVDCEIDRALITLDNLKSSVEALFEIKVYRGDIDPVNYVLGESGIQLVGPDSSSMFMKPIPLSGDQILNIEVTADAMRDGEPLGLESKVVWSQSVSDCPSGFSAQIKVETDCDLGGIVVTMNAEESEIPVIFSIVGVIDEISGEINSYEIAPGGTTQVVIPIVGNSDWNVEWSATNTANTEQTFSGSTPVQEIDCAVEEPTPDPENPFNPDANVNIECRIDRALIKLDNLKSTVDSLFRVEVYRSGIKATDIFSEESGVQLLEAGSVASYMHPISLVNQDILSIVVTAEAIRDGKFIGLEPVVVWEQSVTDCPNGFVGQTKIKPECALGGIEVTLDAKESSITVAFNTTTVVDGMEQTSERFEVRAGERLITNFAIPNGSKWSLKWSVENPENNYEILKRGSTATQTFSCEEKVVVTTTTSTIPQIPEGEEETTQEALKLTQSKEEVCEECCWPWWLFLLLGIAALLGSLGMIALLGLALAALGGKKSGGGCCTKDEGLPGAPLNLSITEKENSYKLCWEKAENGNLPTGYLIEGRIGNDWIDIVTVIGRETWVAIRKSEADEVDAWRVSAANENGRGRASEEIFTS